MFSVTPVALGHKSSLTNRVGKWCFKFMAVHIHLFSYYDCIVDAEYLGREKCLFISQFGSMRDHQYSFSAVKVLLGHMVSCYTVP